MKLMKKKRKRRKESILIMISIDSASRLPALLLPRDLLRFEEANRSLAVPKISLGLPGVGVLGIILPLHQVGGFLGFRVNFLIDNIFNLPLFLFLALGRTTTTLGLLGGRFCSSLDLNIGF